jgi:hypothetical protein
LASDLYSNIISSITGLIFPSVSAAFPSIPIVINNGPFDRDNAPPLWVEVEIDFMNAGQIGPSAIPKTRQRGYVYVCVYARDGTGINASANLLGWFASQLGYARINGVQLQAPEVSSEAPARGWHMLPLKVQFYADSA